MAKKRVSRRPDSFFKEAGASARRAMAGETVVKDYVVDRLPDGATEEDARKAHNAAMREMYNVLMAGGSVNCQGGPAKLVEDIRNGVYDD